MEARGRALVLVLVLVSTVAPLASGQAFPELDCSQTATRIECVAVFESSTQTFFRSRLPSFPDSLVTVSVALTGVDGGWAYSIIPDDGGAVTSSRHLPSRSPDVAVRDFYAQADTHLLNRTSAGAPDAVHTFRLFNCASEVEGPVQDCPYASRGQFRIVIVVENLPPGVAPSRPAATREDPQLLDDGVLDGPEPSLDVLVAWFDDAYVGDGLFDVTSSPRATRTTPAPPS